MLGVGDFSLAYLDAYCRSGSRTWTRIGLHRHLWLRRAERVGRRIEWEIPDRPGVDGDAETPLDMGLGPWASSKARLSASTSSGVGAGEETCYDSCNSKQACWSGAGLTGKYRREGLIRNLSAWIASADPLLGGSLMDMVLSCLWPLRAWNETQVQDFWPKGLRLVDQLVCSSRQGNKTTG